MPNDLLSLKANIDTLDRQYQLFGKAVSCYSDALAGVEKHVLVPCASKAAETPLTLEPQRRALLQNPSEYSFDTARSTLSSVLEFAADHIHRQLAGTVDLAEVLHVLSVTAASLQRRTTERESRFLGVATHLQTAAEQEDVTELRNQIYAQINHITSLVEEMRLENEQIVCDLEKEMHQYRSKLDEAEEVANRDSLTGLANRRVLQSRIQQHIDSGLPFCLLMMDLNRFKAVNDKYGHLAGDELLKLFAARLRRQLRSDDTAARWGGDEFVVILPCRLSDALARARFLEAALRGDYVLNVGSSTLRVSVGVSIGVAERHSSETADQLMARADQLLYHTKSTR